MNKPASTNHKHGPLTASFHDRASGILLSLLWVLGAVTALMILGWLSTQIGRGSRVVVKAEMLDVGGGGGQGDIRQPEPVAGEWDEPATGEASEFKEPDLEQSLSLLPSLVSNNFALADARGSGVGGGEGTDVGDGRKKGTPGRGTEVGTPAWERWELRLSPKNVSEYTKQLDFFQIELGVIGGGNSSVDYISNLSQPKPKVRSGDPKDEQRIYFLQRSSELREADRELALKAGVNPAGRIVVQFYPQEIYGTLLALENEKMLPYTLSDVRRTVFGIRANGAVYEFSVLDQELQVGAIPADPR